MENINATATISDNGAFEQPRSVTNSIVYKVQMVMDELYTNMAKWELMELQRCTRFATNVRLPEAEDLARYFRTLTWVRVTQATEPKKVKDYKVAVHSSRIPNRLSVILSNIGEAYDRDSNIKFIPTCDIQAKDVMAITELMEMSDLLGSYLEDGYATVAGMEKSNLGSVMLMSKLVISEPGQLQQVLSYRKDNPVYAFFAAILQMEIVDLTYQDLFRQYRVQYSSVDQYKYSFQQYYKSVGSDI